MASTGITPRRRIISQLVGGSIRLLTRNITWENNSNHNVLRMFFIDKSSSFKVLRNAPAQRPCAKGRKGGEGAERFTRYKAGGENVPYECTPHTRADPSS